jgi:hypothetical protein
LIYHVRGDPPPAGHDEVLVRAANLLVGRAAYETARRLSRSICFAKRHRRKTFDALLVQRIEADPAEIGQDTEVFTDECHSASFNNVIGAKSQDTTHCREFVNLDPGSLSNG